MSLSTIEIRVANLERKHKEERFARHEIQDQAAQTAVGFNLLRQARGNDGVLSGAVLAKSGGAAIPILVGNQAGSATVRIWNTLAGLRSDSLVDVTAYNMSPTYTVAANTFIILGRLQGGDYYVIVELCP